MIKFICHKKIILKIIDKTGWGYLGKNKASCFISSFFWTKFKNLMTTRVLKDTVRYAYTRIRVFFMYNRCFLHVKK
jgi:hypothetical protein